MVKAMVTFEAVGNLLQPGFNVAEVSKPYINQIFINQFSPVRIAQETMRGAPDLVDALIKAPMLVTEGLKVLEQATQREPENPFAGIRGTGSRRILPGGRRHRRGRAGTLARLGHLHRGRDHPGSQR